MQKIISRYEYAIILIKEMVRSDFKVKYQQSILGYFWSVLRPLFLFAILYAVFTVGLRVGGKIDHWPVALMAGTVIWQFFTDVTKSGMRSIVASGSLLRKIKFPRYTVVIASTLSSLISLLINFVLVAIFALFNGVPLLPTMPLVILVVIEIFIFGLGLAFFLSAVNVKFRDIGHIWDILIRGLFYASAIIYPISHIAHGAKGDFVAKVLLLNPVAQVIQDFRYLAINPKIDTLVTLTNGNMILYLIPVSISIGTFIFGAWYFRRKSPYFAEDA